MENKILLKSESLSNLFINLLKGIQKLGLRLYNCKMSLLKSKRKRLSKLSRDFYITKKYGFNKTHTKNFVPARKYIDIVLIVLVL